LLPCEIVALFAGPSRGIRFNGVDGIGERQGWRDLDEQMNVIVHPADGVNENFVVLADACGVGPHSGLEFFWDEFGAAFGLWC
jgi:hypothetical protein